MIHYCYLWRGRLRGSLADVFLRTVYREAYNKMNTPDFCGFWYRTEIPRAAVLFKNKTKQSPTELLGLFTTFPRNLAAKYNTGINSKVPGCFFFVADQFFQFCYELLLKWQGKVYISIWLFMTKDGLKIGLETRSWSYGWLVVEGSVTSKMWILSWWLTC